MNSHTVCDWHFSVGCKACHHKIKILEFRVLKLLAPGAIWGENIVLGSHLAGPNFGVLSGPSFLLPIRQALPLSLDGHSSVRLQEQALASSGVLECQP